MGGGSEGGLMDIRKVFAMTGAMEELLRRDSKKVSVSMVSINRLNVG